MSAVNGSRAFEETGIGHVAAAERMARGCVVAMDLCEEAGVPLSTAQKIAVVEALLLEFDGLAEHLRSVECVGRMLRDLGRR
jgi:hypothetical protein